MRANKLFIELSYPKKDATAEALEYPGLGATRRIPKLPFGNIPIKLAKTPARTTSGMLPGAHTREILANGWGGNPPKTGEYRGPKGSIEKGVLDGVTVVDMTQGIAGPYASLLLAENGARVIKIEPPEGDYTRGWEPAQGDVSAAFAHLNRNKEGLLLDIRRETDRERLKRCRRTPTSSSKKRVNEPSGRSDWIRFRWKRSTRASSTVRSRRSEPAVLSRISRPQSWCFRQ